MTINGVSQTSGVQRLVSVSPANGGVRVGIRDRKPGPEWALLTAATDPLMALLTERPNGPQAIPGDGPPFTDEVRRNEVLLAIGAMDAAVGLDDLTDAVGSALPS